MAMDPSPCPLPNMALPSWLRPNHQKTKSGRARRHCCCFSPCLSVQRLEKAVQPHPFCCPPGLRKDPPAKMGGAWRNTMGPKGVANPQPTGWSPPSDTSGCFLRSEPSLPREGNPFLLGLLCSWESAFVTRGHSSSPPPIWEVLDLTEF